jgi:deferrochelatase/peroxidase EfeB
MAQAKGVIPRGEDKELLYKNPQTCGYFIFTKLDPALDRTALENFLGSLDQLIASLVEREASSGTEAGKKVAAVAVGLAPSLFSSERFAPPLAKPAGFRSSVSSGSDLPEVATPLPYDVPPISEAPRADADLLFYVASTMEARVNRFLSDLSALPAVKALDLERGYQRLDGTEPFGYKDGLRNIKSSERSTRVFVHRDERHLEEPHWTDGGTYMAYMKIAQHPERFAELGEEAARDAAIGRRQNGERLDLVGQGVDPHDEPDTPPSLPPGAHVGKAGPRGSHDDTEIFRRGLPFVETAEGLLRVGLNFASFQASLDQFDVVLNDWIMNLNFPSPEGGRDALLDPNKGIVTFEKVGLFFVPPHDPGGLTAAVMRPEPGGGKPRTGKVVVRKRVVDPTDPTKRFERADFVFQILDSNQQPVGGQFSSDSTGRALAPEELIIGNTYTLKEISTPFGEKLTPVSVGFTMDTPHKELAVENHFNQPNNQYGG